METYARFSPEQTLLEKYLQGDYVHSAPGPFAEKLYKYENLNLMK